MENDWPAIIMHADMDAFYAAVEQLDNPDLRHKPILIGPNSYRGVVLTASYEARAFGVGSAMPMAEARRLCPEALCVSPRFDRYQQISEQVMNIFTNYSPDVEAISLDEAFLDMTGSVHIFGPPRIMAEKLKQDVWNATRLHISVGVASTKYVAKVASAYNKPNGLTVVPGSSAQSWLAPLPVNRLWGVGKKNQQKLEHFGYQIIADVQEADPQLIEQQLGWLGRHVYELANARDPRKVSRSRGARSIGSDRTLQQDISSKTEILIHLRRSAERISRRLRAKRYAARGVRIRLKTTKFELLSRQRKSSRPIDTAQELLELARQLVDEFSHPGPFRLVGMAAFDLGWRTDPLQLDMFEDGEHRQLETTIDDLIDRFGQDVVVRCKDLEFNGTLGSNGVNLDFLDVRDGERLSHPDG